MSTEIPTKRIINEQDEISLVDLLDVILRRKVIVLTVFVLCLLGAVVVATLKTDKYLYSLTIESALIVGASGVGAPFDNQSNLVARINEGYIPKVLSDYRQGKVEGGAAISISATIPRNSSLISLESTGAAKDDKVIVELQEKVIALLKSEYARVLEIAKRDQQADMESAQRNLVSQQELQGVLENKLKYNAKLHEQLQRQLAEGRQQLADLTSSRKRMGIIMKDATQAMTVLLLNKEIADLQRRIQEWEERLKFGLSEANIGITMALSNTIRAQATERTNIDQIELKLRTMAEPQAVIAPTFSVKTVGAGSKMILALGIVLGGMLGLLSAFIVEFIVKVRAELATKRAAAVSSAE